MKDTEPACAVVRLDRFLGDEIGRITVKEVVWSVEEAEREIKRLNGLNADRGCLYIWQHTRVKPRG